MSSTPINISRGSVRQLVIYKAQGKLSKKLSHVALIILEKAYGVDSSWVGQLKSKLNLKTYGDELKRLKKSKHLDLYYLFLVLQECHAELYKLFPSEPERKNVFKQNFNKLKVTWDLRNTE